MMMDQEPSWLIQSIIIIINGGSGVCGNIFSLFSFLSFFFFFLKKKKNFSWTRIISYQLIGEGGSISLLYIAIIGILTYISNSYMYIINLVNTP